MWGRVEWGLSSIFLLNFFCMYFGTPPRPALTAVIIKVSTTPLSVSQSERLGPIDRTPGTPGSGNNFSLLFRDRDQDKNWRNCAELRRGGWWHNYCNSGMPTGLQSNQSIFSTKHITWYWGGARGNSYASWAGALYELVPN